MSIAESFYSLNLPKGIETSAISIANDIQSNMGTKTRNKSKNRKYLIFISIYVAYQRANIHIDMIMMGKSIGITKREMEKAFTEYTELKHGIPIEILDNMTTEQYIMSCSNVLQLSDNFVTQMIKHYKYVLSMCPYIEINTNPRTIAIAFIKYYSLKESGKDIGTKHLNQIFDECETSISNYFNNFMLIGL